MCPLLTSASVLIWYSTSPRRPISVSIGEDPQLHHGKSMTRTNSALIRTPILCHSLIITACLSLNRMDNLEIRNWLTYRDLDHVFAAFSFCKLSPPEQLALFFSVIETLCIICRQQRLLIKACQNSYVRTFIKFILQCPQF